MTPQHLLNSLFEPPEAGDQSDIRTFLTTWGLAPDSDVASETDLTAFARLVRVALRADRRSYAVAAGHQAAIRRLFPETPDDSVTAFCISEDQGPQPSRIFTSLVPQSKDSDHWILNGSKRWGSMSPDADILYVAASIGQTDGRNQLRMVKLPADRDGISIDTTPYEERQSEMRIADLTFSDVVILYAEIVQADAYDAYIKPFRLIEDVYSTAATQIALLRLARDYHWPEETIEDFVALIFQAQSVTKTDMASAPAILLLSAYLRASGKLWAGLGTQWQLVPEEIRNRWHPELGLLEIAARARETRRQNAWAELKSVQTDCE